MKRIMCMALAGVLLLPAALRAEGKPEGKPEAHGEKGGKESFKERMKEKFDISDEQEGKLKAAKRARRDGEAAIHAEIGAAIRKLQDQVEDKASEKDLSATLDKIVAARKSLRAEEDKFEAALSSILTPTQRAKMLVAMKGHMGGMHGGKMGPGKMGPGKMDEKPEHRDDD
jgi:Spy/CpxP family protein refolding chaperone